LLIKNDTFRITFALSTGLIENQNPENMKTIRQVICIALLCAPFLSMATLKTVSYTIEDRDRMIRTKQRVESLRIEMNARFEGVDKQFVGIRSEMNARFEAIDKRFDQLFNFLWALIGIFTTMMVSVFGFAFWDRKLSLAPLKMENQKTLRDLRDFAEHQPRLKEILKNAGLL